MWSQMAVAGEELRPDKCGVIFDRVSDDVITARLEEGKKLNGFTFAQVNRFIDEGFSVLIFRGKEMKHFLNEHHTEQYVTETVRDRAELH